MAAPPVRHVADFYSGRAGYALRDLPAGSLVVAASDGRCLGKSRTALWMAVFDDRAVVVTQHRLLEQVRRIVEPVGVSPELLADAVRAELLAACEQDGAIGAGLWPYDGIKLYCAETTYPPVDSPDVRQLSIETADEAIAALEAIGMPSTADYLLEDNAAFAYYLHGRPVAFAGTHPVGGFRDRIGNTMVATLEPYRRRGFGSAVISATTGALLGQGRVAVWGAAPDNVAALRTAAAVGYQVYCRVFELRFATA